jgi:hypothetical protein
MRFVAVTLFCAGAALAQHATSLDKMPAAVNGFYASRTQIPLPCTVTPAKPALNFGFQFQTGYELRTSLDPYQGGKHHWDIAFQVTPEENPGQPVYFLDSIDLPANVQSGFIAKTSGTFLVGQGRYDVKWSLLDDLGRVCRQAWTVDARLDGKERSATVLMPPDTAGDYSWRPRGTAAVIPVGHRRHITILLNAAIPINGHDTGSPASQWGTLLSMLASLLERMRADTVRLVVFNLDQQRELFRQDAFTAGEIERVSHAADGREQWAVDYHVLLKPDGGWDLLRDIENKEIHATVPSDEVIFLGLPQSSAEAPPPGMPAPGRAPRFYYLKYRAAKVPASPTQGPASGRGGGAGGGGGRGGGRSVLPGLPSKTDQPDPIEESVRSLKGKTITISSPAAFNKAIENIEH